MKNVLFITYYWPPSGKATLHWPLAMIRHLPQYDRQPSVLTASEDTFAQKDDSLLAQIDPQLNIVRAKSLEPFALYRKFLGKDKNTPLVASETISAANKSLRHRFAVWLRLNLFIPDARIGWRWNAVREGKRFIRSHKIDAIVSIGPPHTTLLVGKKLSKEFGIPHIPVFIDPWVDISYYSGLTRTKFAVAIDRKLERSVLEQAKHVVFVTKSLREDYSKRYQFLQSKSSVLYWGYDEEAFSSYKPEQTGDYEILLHAGNIFDHQNPKELWKTLRQEIALGRKLKLVFIGSVSPAIRKSLEQEHLLNYTEFKGFLPYGEMIEELSKATYVLICASEKRHVPGKLFEYLRSGKPILAFGDDNDEVKNILTEANAGMIFPLNSNGKEFFLHTKEYHTDQQQVAKYERRAIAKQLSKFL